MRRRRGALLLAALIRGRALLRRRRGRVVDHKTVTFGPTVMSTYDVPEALPPR